MADIGIGIVGIGFGQHALVPAFRAQSGCRVVAIAASDRRRAERVASHLTIERAYGDWRELLDSKSVDAVATAVPPAVNPEMTLEALARRKGVFSEKPMAASVAAAREMAAAAGASGLANMVDFEFPEIPAWRAARRCLDSGEIGALRRVVVTWNVETRANRERARSWRSETSAGGGALNSFGSHTFHYLEWLLGPIEGLTARLTRAPDDIRRADTGMTVAAVGISRVPISIVINTDAFLGHGHRVEFFGEGGAAVLCNSGPDYAAGFQFLVGTRGAHGFKVVAVPDDLPLPDASDGRIRAVARLAGRFVHWLRSGESAQPDFRSGLRIQQLIEAARTAHEQGRWISGLQA